MKNTDFLECIINHVNRLGFEIDGRMIHSKDIIFEERVKMNCFYCGKYGENWKCPPNIPVIDYKKMITEYENCAFIYHKSYFLQDNYEQVRAESSVKLHKALLECEKWLYEHDNSTAISFIGGSCKLCKNGCSKERCSNPYLSRTPVEALGINVVESAKAAGIEVKFPPKDYMIRIGLLLW